VVAVTDAVTAAVTPPVSVRFTVPAMPFAIPKPETGSFGAGSRGREHSAGWV
jgi:hypothetical protein